MKKIKSYILLPQQCLLRYFKQIIQIQNILKHLQQFRGNCLSVIQNHQQGFILIVEVQTEQIALNEAIKDNTFNHVIFIIFCMKTISNYIQQQLNSLLQQIECTPPKKYSSLAKIKQLVKSAHLPETDRRNISRSIKKVETAIITYCTPSKPATKSSRNIANNSVDKHNKLYLSDQKANILVDLKLQKTLKNEQNCKLLQRYYQQLRSTRESMDKELQQLIIKVQRLQRWKKSKATQQQKVIEQSKLTKQYRDKSRSLGKIKEQTIEAVQKNRKNIVQVLMKKFYEGIN